MRNKTQERIEELARERAAASIDLALVEDGIEIGKQMMAEMIANYSVIEREPRRRSGGAAIRAPDSGRARGRRHERRSGYLNEVSPTLTPTLRARRVVAQLQLAS